MLLVWLELPMVEAVAAAGLEEPDPLDPLGRTESPVRTDRLDLLEMPESTGIMTRADRCPMTSVSNALQLSRDRQER